MALVSAFPEKAHALIGGRLAKEGEFPAVVTFLGVNCTAAKIGPYQFLMAGHCLSPFGKELSYLPGDLLEVFTGIDQARMTSYRVTVREAFVHPSWLARMDKTHDRSRAVGQRGVIDLAVLEIVEKTPNIPIEAVNLSPVSVSTEVIMGGYGCETNFSRMSHRYKVANKLITKIKSTFFSVEAKDSNGQTASSGCEGDSGGPVHYREGRRKPVIVGVNSFVTGFLSLNEDNTIQSTEDTVSTNFTRLDLPEAQSWLQLILRSQ